MLQMSLLGLVFTWLRRPIEIKFRPDWKLDEVSNQGCNPLEADFFVTRFFQSGSLPRFDFLCFLDWGLHPDTFPAMLGTTRRLL